MNIIDIQMRNFKELNFVSTSLLGHAYLVLYIAPDDYNSFIPKYATIFNDMKLIVDDKIFIYVKPYANP